MTLPQSGSWWELAGERLRCCARFAGPACLLVGVLFVAGCSAPEMRVEPMVARFYLESRPGEAAAAVQLPRSKVQIAVNPKPVLTEYDVAGVSMAKSDIGWCLVFNFNPNAARDLTRIATTARDRRLVLTLNNVAVGARRVDQAVGGGALLIFPEFPDDALPEAADRIRRTSQGLQGRGK